MKFKIRNVKLEESKQVDEFLTKLIHDEKKYDENINENFTVDSFYKNYVDNENLCLAIAVNENDDILGYIFGYILNLGNVDIEKVAKLDALYIEENYRKNNIGNSLIEYFKNWSKSKHISYIELSVCKDNLDAISIYSKNNFKDIKNVMRLKI